MSTLLCVFSMDYYALRLRKLSCRCYTWCCTKRGRNSSCPCWLFWFLSTQIPQIPHPCERVYCQHTQFQKPVTCCFLLTSVFMPFACNNIPRIVSVLKWWAKEKQCADKSLIQEKIKNKLMNRSCFVSILRATPAAIQRCDLHPMHIQVDQIELHCHNLLLNSWKLLLQNVSSPSAIQGSMFGPSTYETL